MDNPTRKIGILGGTFDPIHAGHLLVARHALRSLGLERVLFIPAGTPWLKAGRRVAPARHRMAMTRLAVAGCPRFEASDMEVERPGPTYTADTLAELRERFGAGAALYLILGMDAARDMGRWHQPERVFALCEVVAVPRGEADTDADIGGAPSGIRVLRDAPRLAVSSTEIRAKIAAGASVEGDVPDAAADYIRRHGLYLAGGAD